jgi:hypothetical protein
MFVYMGAEGGHAFVTDSLLGDYRGITDDFLVGAVAENGRGETKPLSGHGQSIIGTGRCPPLGRIDYDTLWRH